MKYRLTALAVLAAIVAVPTIASAATMDDSSASSGISTNFPPIVVPRNGDTTAVLVNSEHAYLNDVCPTVQQHPGDYSAVLNRFCSEPRG